MRAGKLRHRIEVQEDRGVANEFNELEAGWKTIGRRWAQVTQLAGDDRLVRDQFKQSATHRVKIRFMAELTVRHRLKFGTRVLHILAVDDVEGLRAEMVLTCEERLGD